MPSVGENRAFFDFLIDSNIRDTSLDLAIDWISENKDPEEVYTLAQLTEWAENQGYTLFGDDEDG